MTAFIIIIILILVWLIFGARIRAWFSARIQRFIANRTEDFIRQATGMPPRDKKKHREQPNRAYGNDSRKQSNTRRRTYSGRSKGPIIPKEYAEDVEFVEIKEFSQTKFEAHFSDANGDVEYHESQVSDVEWVEIKGKDR
ncbi:MAG: hypothetical protein K2G69_03990 [Muribaculaceae bacterium]|nr:hypothetical protein [Muribaculaceae bacterium]